MLPKKGAQSRDMKEAVGRLRRDRDLKELVRKLPRKLLKAIGFFGF